MQRVLSEYGYGQIKPSGVVDEATSEAIEKFEREHKLPVTGRISDEAGQRACRYDRPPGRIDDLQRPGTGVLRIIGRMRLKTALWVAAYLRRCQVEGISAVVRRRGAEEAGAVFVRIDRLDGTSDLFGPAPQSAFDAAAAILTAPLLQA